MIGARKEEVLVFIRFNQMREEREGGFTLIELLVVILIIAILAAIAIPVFLRQREKGWRSQIESALKNAATAQESYLTTNSGYAATTGALASEGLKYASSVTLVIALPTATGTAYCIRGTHGDLTGVNYWYYSGDGRPRTTIPTVTEAGLTCPAAI
jgi:type IV pilus assembly protein PilA